MRSTRQESERRGVHPTGPRPDAAAADPAPGRDVTDLGPDGHHRRIGTSDRRRSLVGSMRTPTSRGPPSSSGPGPLRGAMVRPIVPSTERTDEAASSVGHGHRPAHTRLDDGARAAPRRPPTSGARPTSEPAGVRRRTPTTESPSPRSTPFDALGEGTARTQHRGDQVSTRARGSGTTAAVRLCQSVLSTDISRYVPLDIAPSREYSHD